MKKTILVFGLLILALLLLFRVSNYALISGNLQSEIVIAIIAIVFFIIGVFINKRTLRKEVRIQNTIDHQKIKELGLSKREYEVLNEIALGLSNQEVADKLFVSESTVKTHVSSLFVKLNAKRRTQAIQVAKDFHII